MFPWGMRGERAGELPVEPGPANVGRLGGYGGRGDVDPAADHDPTDLAGVVEPDLPPTSSAAAARASIPLDFNEGNEDISRLFIVEVEVNAGEAYGGRSGGCCEFSRRTGWMITSGIVHFALLVLFKSLPVSHLTPSISIGILGGED